MQALPNNTGMIFGRVRFPNTLAVPFAYVNLNFVFIDGNVPTGSTERYVLPSFWDASCPTVIKRMLPKGGTFMTPMPVTPELVGLVGVADWTLV